jgi:5-methylcytosine-specific restriction endonuclease McrA
VRDLALMLQLREAEGKIQRKSRVLFRCAASSRYSRMLALSANHFARDKYQCVRCHDVLYIKNAAHELSNGF